MYKLFLTREARKNLAELPREFQEAVAETITAISLSPEEVGKPLLGRLRGYWSARVGNYWVIYTIEGSPRSPRVIVRAIRHRVIAYRGRRRKGEAPPDWD